VIEAASRMRPFPEAAAAITVLRDAGIAVGVLTNSPTASTRALLDDSGLQLDPVIGCDRINAFKPHPDVYGFAISELGLEPNDVWLVAAHWWDVMGAQRAGLCGAWISRTERVRLDHGPAPDLEGADLLEIAERIAAVA
jgi:2-haloacid dehalogenase